MGDESGSCDAVVGRLGAKIQRHKGLKVFLEANWCVCPKIGKFNLAKAYCLSFRLKGEITLGIRQRLATFCAEFLV